jgi:hypothetical protein
MSDPLATYLHDHLAGAVHAIETLKTMRDRQAGTPLGDFASHLLLEVEADRNTLRNLAESMGAGSSTLKETASWLAERASRMKLTHESNYSLGTFEALEFLELGIHGKWALWCALDVAAATDPRLKGVDFRQLAARAETQRVLVDGRRLEAARRALQPEPA